MVHTQDDHWFQVLAGKAPAHDRDTAQAAALRDYLVAEAQHTPPLDAADQRRIMNLLEAKGAFRATTTATNTAAPTAFGRLVRWLDGLAPAGNPFNARFAGFAAAVLAVVALPFLLHGPGLEPDPYGVKGGVNGVLNGVLSGVLSGVATPATPSAVITSPSPAQSAAQLVALLTQHGVVTSLRVDGDNRWVQAQIPPERLPAVQAELLGMGLAANAQGEVSVHFRLQH
jgi:hypothetical protein